MRSRICVALCLLFMLGCEEDTSPVVIAQLRVTNSKLQKELDTLKLTLPSEEPKVAKDLHEAQDTIISLKNELATTQRVLAEKITPELAPFSVLIRQLSTSVSDLQTRMKALEATASRKGHVHSISYLWSQQPGSTEPDR